MTGISWGFENVLSLSYNLQGNFLGLDARLYQKHENDEEVDMLRKQRHEMLLTDGKELFIVHID